MVTRTVRVAWTSWALPPRSADARVRACAAPGTRAFKHERTTRGRAPAAPVNRGPGQHAWWHVFCSEPPHDEPSIPRVGGGRRDGRAGVAARHLARRV